MNLNGTLVFKLFCILSAQNMTVMTGTPVVILATEDTLKYALQTIYGTVKSYPA